MFETSDENELKKENSERHGCRSLLRELVP